LLSLEQSIKRGQAHVAVIGLGYVGLPLAVEFARVGFPTVGVDTDARRVAAINRGESYIPDVPNPQLGEVIASGKLKATVDYDVLSAVDVVFICVPTPFTATKAPDISSVVTAAEGIAQRLRPGQLIVLQSTTHPGTTEEDVLPILERSGLRGGHDFHLAFSPERTNPGDRQFTVANTPKVVGGLTSRCTELARSLLTTITPEVHALSSPRAAEMTKLLENIFRSVNIALVNELAKLAERMGIDIWEVIEAASTKPFGFMPFYPGAGVGGHCIPVDPYYLSWKAREYDFYTKFIEFAAEVNQSMPYHLVGKVVEALNLHGKPLRGSRLLILGVAFKRDIDDPRNSPAERVIELLLDGGASVLYNDPYVPRLSVGHDVFYRENPLLESQPLTDELIASVDCVVIVTGHTAYDYQRIVATAKAVVDSCNATKNVAERSDKVIRVGAPRRTEA